MQAQLKIEKINGVLICIGGIGKMFYQQGFPMSIAIQRLKDNGIEVSLLHVCDELLKNGFSPDTVISKIREDFIDSGMPVDIDFITCFCKADYDTQRGIIFKSVFGEARPRDVIENYVDLWLRR